MRNKKILLGLIILSVVYLILVVYGLKVVYSKPVVEEKVIVKDKPENLILIYRTELFGKPERPGVLFDHEKHVVAVQKLGKKCDVCHSFNNQGESDFSFPKNIKSKDPADLMNAYHDSCIECHKDNIKAKRKSGPITCAECHKKENERLNVKYPVAEFDFALHNKHEKALKNDCSLCHHSYDIEEKDPKIRLVYEKGKEESCYYCHDFRNKELTPIQKEAKKKGLDMQRASHMQCINCHWEYIEKGKQTGPVKCTECHSGKYKTVQELRDVPRPNREQPQKTFLTSADATMKEVFFDHSFHEKNNKTCRTCHHYSLDSCKECHTLTGSEKGKGVNLSQAMHSAFAKESCVGCHHSTAKNNKDCAGCHAFIRPVSIDTMSPKTESCNRCHTGKTEPKVAQISKPTKVKENIKIDILAREFEPSEFPHLKIINNLIDVSNKSKLATYFHRDLATLCGGCHHNTPKSDLTENKAPLCRSCHYTGTPALDKTGLISAYHRGCLGCHEEMNLDKGRKCSECHKESDKKPKEIITEKNRNVVRQNKEKILNVWHP